MLRVIIVADDLSGAADSAIACIGSGMSASVDLGNLERECDVEVLSVDCDTRHLESEAAARRVTQLLLRYTQDRELIFFKKIDSTLRGNVAAELLAMLEVRRRSFSTNSRVVAIMAPAFPASGRTTVGGYQLVHGKPLHESETWIHQQSSDTTHIPTILATAGMKAVLLGLDVVRSGKEVLKRSMITYSTEADVLVCDAETDEDLRSIAVASLALGQGTIWAGSAGLARHLPHVAGQCGEALVVDAPEFSSCPTLTVIGSMSSVTREQVDVLERESSAKLLPIAPRILIDGPQSMEWCEYTRNLTALLRGGKDVIVTLESGESYDRSMGRLFSSALGAMMAPFANIAGALIASGGETARAIFDTWEIAGLRMIREVEPGLPFSVTEGWRRPLPVLTKAGAFGNPSTLLRGWEFLRNLDRNKTAL